MTPDDVRSIRDAFDVRVRSLHMSIDRAFDAIDSVHLVRPLPRIPIREVAHPDDRGAFQVQVNRGRPIAIRLDPQEPRPILSLVHEIGHFLDHQAIGSPGAFASRRHAELAQWRAAVGQSSAYQRLAAYRRASTAELSAIVGEADVLDARSLIKYYLRLEELWARSYAQFVAARSANPLLNQELAEERQAAANLFEALSIWELADAWPIFRAIEAVFQRRGWMP